MEPNMEAGTQKPNDFLVPYVLSHQHKKRGKQEEGTSIDHTCAW
jgi:hypothetical protein